MFVKILDDKTARALSKSGFAFTVEKRNKNFKVYVFEDTIDLRKMLIHKYSHIEIFEDNALTFGGGG